MYNVDINVKSDKKTLRKLQEDVKKLDKIQQYEIYKIIKKFNNKLTENNNGIFINLSYLSNECIIEINNFIKYSIDNKKRLNKIEKLSDSILKTKIINLKSDKLNSKKEKKELDNLNIIINNMDNKQNNTIKHNCNLDKDYMIYIHDNDNDDNDNDDNDNDDNDKSILKNIGKLNINEDKDDIISIKKNKYTGKCGRLFKKCKEIYKNNSLNTLVNYNNYYIESFNELDNQKYNLNMDELTEDKFERDLK